MFTTSTTFTTFEKIQAHVELCDDLLEKDGKVDCFVNPSNPNLEHGSQVSTRLHDAGGRSYQLECDEVQQRMRQLKTSECLVAKTGEALRTKNVIHTVCPGLSYLEKAKKDEKNKIFETVFNCLQTAEKNNFSSVALTFLSTGQGNYPIEICSLQYALAVIEFSRERQNTFVVTDIYFVDRDAKKVEAVKQMFKNILPNHVMQLLEMPQSLEDDSQAASHTYENLLIRNKQDNVNYTPLLRTADTEEKQYMESTGNTCRLEETEGKPISGEDNESYSFVNDMYDQVPGRKSEPNKTSNMCESLEKYDHVTEKICKPDTDVSPADDIATNEGFDQLKGEESLSYSETNVKSDAYDSFSDDNAFVDPERKREFVHGCFNFKTCKLIIKKGDIRDAGTVAVVCPENCDVPFGGFLAVAIKCKYDRNNIRPDLLKKVAEQKRIATSEIATDGKTRYIMHVPVTVWKSGSDEREIKADVAETVRKIFDKFFRPKHMRRNITSVAIPLLGIQDVESEELVRHCCEAQAQTVWEILSEREIPNLETVYLLNRCSKISSMLNRCATVTIS